MGFQYVDILQMSIEKTQISFKVTERSILTHDGSFNAVAGKNAAFWS
jgi:hypothetical protein